jgi:hypothetical protein
MGDYEGDKRGIGRRKFLTGLGATGIYSLMPSSDAYSRSNKGVWFLEASFPAFRRQKELGKTTQSCVVPFDNKLLNYTNFNPEILKSHLPTGGAMTHEECKKGVDYLRSTNLGLIKPNNLVANSDYFTRLFGQVSDRGIKARQGHDYAFSVAQFNIHFASYLGMRKGKTAEKIISLDINHIPNYDINKIFSKNNGIESVVEKENSTELRGRVTAPCVQWYADKLTQEREVSVGDGKVWKQINPEFNILISDNERKQFLPNGEIYPSNEMFLFVQSMIPHSDKVWKNHNIGIVGEEKRKYSEKRLTDIAHEELHYWNIASSPSRAGGWKTDEEKTIGRLKRK